LLPLGSVMTVHKANWYNVRTTLRSWKSWLAPLIESFGSIVTSSLVWFSLSHAPPHPSSSLPPSAISVTSSNWSYGACFSSIHFATKATKGVLLLPAHADPSTIPNQCAGKYADVLVDGQICKTCEPVPVGVDPLPMTIRSGTKRCVVPVCPSGKSPVGGVKVTLTDSTKTAVAYVRRSFILTFFLSAR